MPKAKAPVYTAEELRSFAQSGERKQILIAAKDPRCPVEELVRLAEKSDSYTSRTALANPSLPLDTVASRVAWAMVREKNRYGSWRYRSESILIEASERRDLTPEILDLMEGYLPALQHPNLSIERMRRVVAENKESECIVLARNKNLPQEIQSFFVRHPKLPVRKAFAINPSMTDETARLMKADRSPIVLRKLLRNKRALAYQAEIADRLAGKTRGEQTNRALAKYSHNTEVVAEVLEAELSRASGKYDPTLIQNAMKNPHLDEEFIEQKSYSPNAKIRDFAAKHPKATDETRVVVALLRETGEV